MSSCKNQLFLQSKRFNEKRVAFHTTELVLGLEFLHEKVSAFPVSPVKFYRATSTVTSNQKMWCWPWRATLSLQILACAKRSILNNMVCVTDTFLRTWTLVLRPARSVAPQVSWPLKYSYARSTVLQWTGNLFNVWSNLYCVVFYSGGLLES